MCSNGEDKAGMKTSKRREAALEMSPEEFRRAGYKMVDRIAEFLATLPERPVTPGRSPSQVQAILGDRPVPEGGADASALLEETADLLINNSLFNGHPQFLGYITSSAAPIGTLGDLLASSINPNLGGWLLSPIATEIERETVRWIAELIGYPSDCGGLLVSGGNMANFVGFLTGRYAKAKWNVQEEGLTAPDARPLGVYVSAETHTWIEKAGDLFGLGNKNVRWIPTGPDLRMDTRALRRKLDEDREAGILPFLVVGTAGSVGTGVIDPLPELRVICDEYDLWFHADGAYGAFAAMLPDAPADLKALNLADSVALDPHKWLYAPLEAGCVLVRDPEILRSTFDYSPSYYKFDTMSGEEPFNFVHYGPQNSRGFRALKVWLAIRHVGRQGYVRMIADDIEMARELYRMAEENPQLEAKICHLSIATFRYVPRDVNTDHEEAAEYLNELNDELLTRLQNGGETFVSNAVIDGVFYLRGCVVNFRTDRKDIEAIPGIVTRIGAEVDAEMRPAGLRA
jgi:glutamate/tyrosine decarboxylase-like PLP-dependent enzyme